MFGAAVKHLAAGKYPEYAEAPDLALEVQVVS